MAKRSDDQPATAEEIQLLLEGPKKPDGTAESPIIDLEPLAGASADSADSAAEAEAASSENHAPHAARRRFFDYAPLAAGIALAITVGAVAGAAGTLSLLRDTSSTASIAATKENRALRDSVAQLGNDLATLKSGLATAQRSTSTQFGKLAERLDRAEKAQAEPATKLAKIQESLDRLDHRQQQAAAAPPPAPEITGSIAAPKEETRPPLAEGWRLRDFYAGHAVVQSRNGTLFEIGPGSNLPGLGRVSSIKRENGQVVVVAQNGTIAGSVAQRRPPYMPPYRY